ncbi:MAG: DUF933 domain-containing protein, partial [Thermodesulfobacteriota bacterium]|nr:DUF933 domain-containing protein [Thermodesulfobacteriota bacterium]
NFTNVLDDPPTPVIDIEQMETELLISDLIICEKRLEKIGLSHKRGQKTPSSQMEETILRRILNCLNDGRRITDIELGRDEQKMMSGFQFLTAKQLLIVLNSSEDRFGKDQELLKKIGEKHTVVEFAGTFEMELFSLDDDERQLFMGDIGITESARDRLKRSAYEISSYISFFTVGTDEVRAWNIHEGQSAVEAADVIHSDLARGFIRAECFSYDDLIECGSEKGVHDKGRFRLEGKDYIVKDGDILAIRFSV